MAVTLEHVAKAFDGRMVLRDVNLRIEQGERVCLFGPSGCGKTTLLRLICGLDKPDAGKISRPEHLRFSCHFQEDRLLPWYTTLENLTLILGDAASDWLNRVELSDAAGLYPDELSGGMRRRVSLARALGHDSDLVVLDEPVRELDTALAGRMLSLIDGAVAGRGLLLVTHDRHQAEQLGCRLIDLPM